jgi:hypothetical protein
MKLSREARRSIKIVGALVVFRGAVAVAAQVKPGTHSKE